MLVLSLNCSVSQLSLFPYIQMEILRRVNRPEFFIM